VETAQKAVSFLFFFHGENEGFFRCGNGMETVFLYQQNQQMGKIMIPKIVAIVIAQSDRFRDSIQILLSSISQIDEIYSVGSITEALGLAAKLTPSIVILDSQALSLDLPTALKLIGETWQGTNQIVLVEDKDEFQQAMDLHTDLVLLKGFNASKFIDSIEEILEIR